MKKQQKRRANAQMIMANHEARPMSRRQKPAAEDTALLISQSQSNTSLNGKHTYTYAYILSHFFLFFTFIHSTFGTFYV